MDNEKAEVLVLEIIDRRPSNWVLDGSEESGLPQRLDAPADYMPKTTSVVREPKAGGGYTLRKIRYIQGCDTIYVDEQDKQGIKPNPAVDRNDLTFKNGSKYVVNNGGTIGLYNYLKNYEGNKDNPNRPPNADVKFKEIKAEEIAQVDISSFDDMLEANKYLATLKVSGNGKEAKYKRKELDFLCSLFKVGALSSDSEKFAALISIVQADPKTFNNTIADVKSGMISEIHLALNLGVIQFDETKAMLVNSSKVILTFKSNNKNERPNELALFFLSEEGEMLYKQFAIELKAKREVAALDS